MNKEQNYLIYLIKNSIASKSLELAQPPFNWQYFCNYATEQQYEQLLYPLFKEDRPDVITDEALHKMHQRYGQAIVRDSKQDMALFELSEMLNEAQIPHIPLKGSVIKHYYPKPELRRSGDLDVLVHESDLEKAAEIIEGLGYERETEGRDMHDSFTKGAIHIELHKTLTGSDNSAYEWCLSAWDYAYPESEYEYRLENEFMYVYLMVHLKMHLIGMGGGGIKLIADFAVLDENLELDRKKLAQHLQAAKAINFSIYINALVGKWFRNESVTDDNVLLLEDMILNSGAYGNYDTYLDMQLAKNNTEQIGGKVKNLIRLLFPSLDSMQRGAPILRKMPFLLPFFWIKRFIFSKKEHRRSFVSSMAGYDEEKAKRLRNFAENIQK